MKPGKVRRFEDRDRDQRIGDQGQDRKAMDRYQLSQQNIRQRQPGPQNTLQKRLSPLSIPLGDPKEERRKGTKWMEAMKWK